MFIIVSVRQLLLAGFAFFCLSLPVLAGSHYDPLQPLDGQYTVSASATASGPDTFLFVYDIKNNNQGTGLPTGLDAFELLVPVSAAITNVSNPLSYSGSPGYWSFSERESTEPGFKKLYWLGAYEQSIYPVDTTAHFSFQAAGVAVGTSAQKLTTYKYGNATDWYYSAFSGMTTGPVSVAVPEPSTFVLAGIVFVGAAAWRMRKRGK